MKGTKKIAFISTLAIACFFTLTAVGLAQDSGSGKYLKSKFIAIAPIIIGDGTTSTSFATIPNTTINFKNNKKTRVRVTLSAQTACQDNDQLLVHVLLDGAIMGIGSVLFTQRHINNGEQVSTFVWVSTGKVAPGSHTVEMQFRVLSSGDFCWVWDRNTIVDYFK